MPSSRGNSSGKSSEDSRLSNSLVQAGQNISFNKHTIDATPSRVKEKKNIIKKLQTI